MHGKEETTLVNKMQQINNKRIIKTTDSNNNNQQNTTQKNLRLYMPWTYNNGMMAHSREAVMQLTSKHSFVFII